MKRYTLLSIFLALLMSMASVKVFAYAFESKNAEGVTIYYNFIYIDDETALEVTNNNHIDCYSGAVLIPEEVTYMDMTLKVKGIGSYAFYECSTLTTVTIPNSVTYIGEGSFEWCSDLTSLVIPSSVTSIGQNPFQGCSSLASITVDVSNPIYDSRDNCHAIIRKDDGVLIIGCQNTVIPYGVTSIGNYAFSGCESLPSIDIPNSVTTIGDNAFRNCFGLTSVTIPNSVISIGKSSFAGCYHLNSVILGKGLTSIGKNAFETLTTISYIISLIEEPFRIYGRASENCTFSSYLYSKLYVPYGTKEKYMATEGWKDFANIEEGTGPEGGDDKPDAQKCATPTISYKNGHLTFNSETEGATYHYTISDDDLKTGSGNTLKLGVTYRISVYASKSGYNNSDKATATLCWVDVSPKAEGITDIGANIDTKPVLIQSSGSKLIISGGNEGTVVCVYDTAGRLVGDAIILGETTTVGTTLRSGEIAIVKIGDKTLKVMIK